MKNHIILLFLLTFLTLPFKGCLCTGWFSDSKDKHGSKSKDTTLKGHNLVAEFPMHGLDYRKEVELPENAKSNLRGVNPCWFNAQRSLFSTCKDLAAEEKRSRLAWLLSDCFQQDTGRNSFPSCNSNTPMVDCLRSLNNHEHQTYLEYYQRTKSICHRLHFTLPVRRDFSKRFERLGSTEEKLGTLEEKSNDRLHNSNQIRESIVSIDAETRRLGRERKKIVNLQ